MEERKYTFYDRYQKVKYANITPRPPTVINSNHAICISAIVSSPQIPIEISPVLRDLITVISCY